MDYLHDEYEHHHHHNDEYEYEYNDNDGDGLSEMGSQNCGSTITSATGLDYHHHGAYHGSGGRNNRVHHHAAPPPRSRSSNLTKVSKARQHSIPLSITEEEEEEEEVDVESRGGSRRSRYSRHSRKSSSQTASKGGGAIKSTALAVVSPHKETKDPYYPEDDYDEDDARRESYIRSQDDDIYSHTSSQSQDPDGEYIPPPNHATTVEEYAAMARRKASFMTQVDFGGGGSSKSHRSSPRHHGNSSSNSNYNVRGDATNRSTTSSNHSDTKSKRSAKRRARVEKSKDALLSQYYPDAVAGGNDNNHYEARRNKHSFVAVQSLERTKNGDRDLLSDDHHDHDYQHALVPIGIGHHHHHGQHHSHVADPADQAGGGAPPSTTQQQHHHQQQRQPQGDPSKPQTMVGSHILTPASDASTSSTVSSISSVDSYMRQQLLLRELAKYKRERELIRNRQRKEGLIYGESVLMEVENEIDDDDDHHHNVEVDRDIIEEEEYPRGGHGGGMSRGDRMGGGGGRGDWYEDEEGGYGGGRSSRHHHHHDQYDYEDHYDDRRHPHRDPHYDDQFYDEEYARSSHHPPLSTRRSRSVTPPRRKSFHSRGGACVSRSFHSQALPSRRPHSHGRDDIRGGGGGGRMRRGRRGSAHSSFLGAAASYISGAVTETSSYYSDDEGSYYYDPDFHSVASSRGNDPHEFDHEDHRGSTAITRREGRRSTSFHSSTKSGSGRSTSRSVSARSSSARSTTHGHARSVVSGRSTSVSERRRRSSSRSTTARSHATPSGMSGGGDNNQPVYQLEECCIKHPDILLSDQTNIDVWTCMRYCKDEKSGRWITVKKVCQVCLEEMQEREDEEAEFDNNNNNSGMFGASSNDNYDDSRSKGWGQDAPEGGSYAGHSYDHSYDDRSSSQYSSHNNVKSARSWDETASMSDSQQDIDDAVMRDTINVHPTFGEDGNQTPLEREAEAQRRRFIRRLAARAYHFPGNTWCEDWMQYMSNTHLVLGIFFHHPLHPVTGRERCIILLGSVAVGLLMSNLIYLWFVHANIDIDESVISFGTESLNVTKLMITLWTLGSVVHTLFDLSVWHIKACTLCRYGGNVSDEAMKCGRTAGVTIVLSTLAFATYLVLLRASSDFKQKEEQQMLSVLGSDADIPEEEEKANVFFESISLAGGAQSFDFLAGYIIEFVLAVFVYNPFLLTLTFTGVMGCNGRIPVLGGRPREVAKEQRYAMKRQRYTMPQTLKLGDEEFEADMWGDANQKLATNF